MKYDFWLSIYSNDFENSKNMFAHFSFAFCKNTYIVDDNMKNICSRQVSRRGSRIDLLRLWSFHLVNQNDVSEFD